MQGLPFICWCLCLANCCVCKPLKFEDVAFLAYDVLSLGKDFIDSITSDDDFVKVQEMINKLRKSMEELHNKLNYISKQLEDLLFVINELPYKPHFLSTLTKSEAAKLILITFCVIQIVQRLVASLKNVMKLSATFEQLEDIFLDRLVLDHIPFLKYITKKTGIIMDKLSKQCFDIFTQISSMDVP